MEKKNSQSNEKKAFEEVAKVFKESIKASTYTSDVNLFEKLGLKQFLKIPTHEKYFVGEVKFKNSSIVKIWVSPMPAQFWTFEIAIKDRKDIIVLTTGSGSLSNFWETIKLFAENMLEVEVK